MALERWLVKVLCVFGLFVTMAFFVLLPIKVSHTVTKMGARGRLIISVLSCFGGGVFVGAYLTHMNPEVRAVLEESLMKPNNITYPLPELLAGVGFFLILFIERFVQKLRANSELSHMVDEPTSNGLVSQRYDGISGNANGGPGVTQLRAALDKLESPPQSPVSLNGSGHRDSSIFEMHWALHHNGPPSHIPKYLAGDTISVCSSSTAKVVVPAENASDHGAQTRSIVFMVAMSLDCIFEGLALGLMNQAKDAVDIFVAVISHEFIMSFCIGLELAKYHRTSIVVAGGLFYAFTPVIGAVIGICIAEVRTADTDQTAIDIATGVLQAMSAGTFIYCSFLGILKDNLDNDHGMLKSVVVLLGFSLMAGMAAIPPSSDNVDHAVANLTTPGTL